MKVLLEVKGTLEKVEDLLRVNCSEVKGKGENDDCENDDCAIKIYVAFYLLYKQVDGINLLQIPARDMTAYGRSLLDVLISKEEKGSSVVLKTKKVQSLPCHHAGYKNYLVKRYECIAVCFFF